MTAPDDFDPDAFTDAIGSAFQAQVPPSRSEWRKLSNMTLPTGPLPPPGSPAVVFNQRVLNYRNLRVAISGFISAKQTRDGGWIVQVPPSGAQVTAIYETDNTDPEDDPTRRRNNDHRRCGWALNWAGSIEGNVSPLLHNNQPTLPIDVVPEDALIVCRQTASYGNRGDYPYSGGRSYVDQCVPIVFVSWTPVDGMIRPPAIGNSDLTRFFRSQPLLESALDVASLPSVVNFSTLPVNWQAWGHGEPTHSYLTKLFANFCGEVYAGWNTDIFTPDWQNVGYGRDFASIVSLGLIRLCSTDSTATKTPLAMLMAQWGYDLAGAFGDGRVQIVGGGHSQGRKALIMLFGKLAGITYLQNPSAYVGNVFQEDLAYFQTNWWEGDWTYGWRFNTNGSPTDGQLLASPPANWGSPVSAGHETWAWCFSSYMEDCCGAQMGTVLAMELMGLENEFGENICGMVEQFVNGPDPTPLQDLINAGMGGIGWGEDYASGLGVSTARTAWDVYHSPFSF